MRIITIGFTGQLHTGKTTIASKLMNSLYDNKKKDCEMFIFRKSFGDSLKEEVSKIYNFDLKDCYSQSGKMKLISLNVKDFNDIDLIPNYEEGKEEYNYPVRKLLQYYGTDYTRKKCNNYWINKIREKFIHDEEAYSNADCIIQILDDVRFFNEYTFINSFKECYSVLIEPFENYEQYIDVSTLNHASEEIWYTHENFNIVFSDISYGEQYINNVVEHLTSILKNKFDI